MMGKLLLRGMLVGVVAGLLAFGFLRLFGEPSVDRAIGFEQQQHEAELASHHGAPAAGQPVDVPDEPELVSRPVQAGWGLLTGVGVYCAAFGGLFAIAFACCTGRLGRLGARTEAAALAGAGFVAVYLVPSLKYPANPPSVGQPETIGSRTALYVAMVALSLATMIAAVSLARRLAVRWGGWNAAVVAGAGYLVIMAVLFTVLPVVDEVPEAFPAVVLWQFRLASLGGQAILWVVLGLGFGALAERVLGVRPSGRSALARQG